MKKLLWAFLAPFFWSLVALLCIAFFIGLVILSLEY
jgi:hypothetical protein